MDWSGEWWVLILGPGLVILVVGVLYFTRSRAFRFRSAAAQLDLIALQGLNPISDEARAGNEAAVRAFFNLPFLDRLTASDSEAGWSVEKAGRWLLIYRHNQFFAPDAIPESLQRAQALAKLFLESR